ncbi:MAG TPA: hypothetical protein VFD52_04630, partial [Clostridia bacterium]|nr:hypothetical protein [Clostridia bacterium]
MLVFIAQAVKIIFRNKAFTKHISQNALFWIAALEALFIGYMFLNNAGFNKIQAIYFRVTLVILAGIVLLFWYPKSKIKNNIAIKAVAVILALVYAVFPFLQSDTKEITLTTDPVVFVVEDEYQIVWHTTEPSIGWVSVGENVYEDSSGGTMKTLEKVHKVSVPMAQLDTEKSYTVHAQKVEREPYV